MKTMERKPSNAFDTERHTMSADDLKTFYTKDGWLSVYALMCGYVEQVDESEKASGLMTTLWHEGVVYHVRQHNFKEGRRVFWDVFEKVGEARKRFVEATK